MPHVLIKIAAGRDEARKTAIAEAVTRAVMAEAGVKAEDVSVAIEDVRMRDWMAQVFEPEIAGRKALLFKKPGYGPAL